MRTFIAVDCNNKEKILNIQQMIRTSLLHLNGNIKPTLPENLHFTLFFFGDIDDTTVERIKHKINEIRFEEFEISYKKIGAFPTYKQPKVIWIGLDDNSKKKLNSLFELVKCKMEQIGFKPDKQFKPHLTLFRVKRPIGNIEEYLSKHSDLIGGFEIIDKIHIKKSELFPSGPVYSNILTVFATNKIENEK
jgi:RNA 2',3'-cyclic 3'-phosphodiesterase